MCIKSININVTLPANLYILRLLSIRVVRATDEVLVLLLLLTSLCYISSVTVKLPAGSTNINLKWVIKLHVRLKFL